MTERLVIVNIAMFLIWGAIAYLVVRYRIHIHVSYAPAQSTSNAPSQPCKPSPQRKQNEENSEKEIAAALVALGCKASRAKGIAATVCPAGGDFENMLRRAIQEVA